MAGCIWQHYCYRGLNNYENYFGDSLLWLQFSTPPNPILIVKARTVAHEPRDTLSAEAGFAKTAIALGSRAALGLTREDQSFLISSKGRKALFGFCVTASKLNRFRGGQGSVHSDPNVGAIGTLR